MDDDIAIKRAEALISDMRALLDRQPELAFLLHRVIREHEDLLVAYKRVVASGPVKIDDTNRTEIATMGAHEVRFSSDGRWQHRPRVPADAEFPAEWRPGRAPNGEALKEGG